MISGGVKHTGGAALARHLLNDHDNEVVMLGARRGVLSGNLADAIEELRTGSRSQKPLYHIHVDPIGERQAEQAERFWREFEREFHLSAHAFIEVTHEKGGRRHWHRVYDRTAPDGRLVGFGHDYARREKIARRIEAEFEQQLTPGRHSRAVAAHLEIEGDRQLAARLAALPTPPPGAAVSPEERHQGERTGWTRAEAESEVLAAWVSSDDAKAFCQSLFERGLALAQGDKVPVVINSTGDVWPIARLLGAASHRDGARIGAAVVRQRLEGLSLPSISVARAMLIAHLEAALPVPEADRSRPSPMAAPPVPAPPIGRVAPGPVLHGPEGRFAFGKGRIEMDQTTKIKRAEQNQKIRLVAAAQTAAIGEVDPPNLSLYEKQKRAEARREKHKASLLNKRYSSTVFQGDPLIKFIKEDSAEGVLRISLRTGQTILDDGQKIELVGAIDEEAVKRCMQLCEAKNWQKIAVSGPQEFKDLMWLEGQRRGVTIANHSPSAETIKAYTLELEARRRQESDAAPPLSTEADRARGRASDLDIEQQKAPAVRQPPTILDRPTQAVRLAAIEGRHIDPVRLRRQIETAKIRVTEAARLARIAISHAEYAAKKFKDVSNERDFEVRKEIKVNLDMKASKARNDVRDLKSKSRALLPWHWAAARQAQRDLPGARARAKAATSAADKYKAAGPLQPEFGPMYDKIWKDRERETRSYRTARENAEAARDRQRDAEASLALEAEKLRELEAEAVNRAIDLEAPEREMVEDYDGPSYH